MKYENPYVMFFANDGYEVAGGALHQLNVKIGTLKKRGGGVRVGGMECRYNVA